MLRKRYFKFLGAMVLSTVLVTTVNTGIVKAATLDRLGGLDRYNTARQVAEGVFSQCENVILVNGQGYADAVSATPLAKKLNAPILLTEADKLTSGVLDTIKKIGAKNVYIVGGEGVVKPSIELTLKSSGLKVNRYAKSGGNRYDTNAVVAKEVIMKTGAKKAILVNGQDGYSDALSVASIAAKLEIPVLISNSKKMDKEVKKVVDDYKLEIMAVGGTAVLPDTVVKSVNGKRVAQGQNRYKTNINVLNYFKSNLSFNKMYVASGGNDNIRNFADALVASAAAAKEGSPLVLSGNSASSTDIAASESFVRNNITKDSKITLIGSTGVLSKEIENKMRKIAEYASEGDLEIIGIE
ncbi:cell wall-binding repeat-containing protein [Clostridium tetani]|uniref:Cell wall-binding repeat-containing protein n=1 Tax=Clostridium tetani TaxID=1513 RepID=A0ABY0ER01_CLOTA|nr:cell wall-binding repeat-containing protein [Clostridium tetani]CDI48579.1 S-layer protein / N-acetylmuramoyl-L-alanineamidase [Clostridium tetani 12124569]KHO40093.1 hypothetical protein OR62_02470 [Clostridium tetani]RXI40844.1 cell wall-binding repeat-containing protein [Clostridium tetani]RXI57532.1 cell wall-binding repeat-containing protein [Clostridium tetani]RXI72251.1 cell wall-binding repeat-containing protein [Clostridium tetani]